MGLVQDLLLNLIIEEDCILHAQEKCLKCVLVTMDLEDLKTREGQLNLKDKQVEKSIVSYP